MAQVSSKIRSTRVSSLSPTGFDFTGHVRRLCVDIAERLPEMAHVDMSRVAVRACQTRRATRYGLQASLTPLRFHGGERRARRRGHWWTIDRVCDASGNEMLYLLSFYLPRFLDAAPREKLSTVLHELWHIGPAFDGDIRRHPGRCHAHTHSQKAYDAHVETLTTKWLGLGPPEELYAFLSHDFDELESLHGGVFGDKIRSPKLRRDPRPGE